MFNAYIARYCLRCGRYPVSEFSPKSAICNVCFLAAIDKLLREDEPFRCPRCETVQALKDAERFVCPQCGYVEELAED